MTAIILALAMMFAQQSPAERKARLNDMVLEAPSTRTIEKGDQSNIDEARQVLVRTDAEWTKLWQQHAANRPRPQVDFSKRWSSGCSWAAVSAGFSTAVINATAGNGG
jgi:hypothetical protein